MTSPPVDTSQGREPKDPHHRLFPDRPMGPLENWTWVLAEARKNIVEAHKAPLVAVRTYEIFASFMAQRAALAEQRRRIAGGKR